LQTGDDRRDSAVGATMSSMSASPSPPRRRRLGSLIVDPAPLRLDRDFRLLWAGQAVSTAGRMMTAIVLPYQVYVLTGDVLAVGALSLVQLLPILVFTLGGGAVADAVDRRRLLLITQLGLAAVTVGLALLATVPAPPVVAIYALAFLAGGLGAVDQPARASAIPRLVPPERLQSAISLNQIVFNAGAVVGPAIGGIVLAVLSVSAAYLIDAVTYGAAIAALLLMRPIPPAPGAVRPSVGAVMEGLRFARRRRPVLGTFVVDLVAMVFGSPRSLFPAMALNVFGVGPAGMGLMSSAVALGAMVAALFTGWTTGLRYPGRVVLIAVAVWGFGIAGFGLFTFSFPLALLCLAIAAGADVISAVIRSFIVQSLTPDSLRGRVSSIHILVVTGGPRIGDAEAAAVAAISSPAVSVAAGGILTVVGVGVIALVMPEFAKLDMRVAGAEVAREAEAAALEAGRGTATPEAELEAEVLEAATLEEAVLAESEVIADL
jgi:MFS family permease